VTGAIDIVVNLFTEREVREHRTGLDEGFKEQVRMPPELRGGVSLERYIEKMDAAGIERSLLIAVRAGDLRVRGSFEVPYDYVAEACARYPDRFSGLAGVDPTRGLEQLWDLDRAVRELGFVGAHFYPHWFEMAPDAARMYPIYARCAELGIPIMMQVGQNLVYSRERRLPSVGRPIALDRVAIDFPELKLIGIHLGQPWTEEMIAMCWKHENVFMAGDAYAPKHWPAGFIRYADSFGQDKCMFGTDWPVIDPERAMREVDELGLRPASKAKLLRENALKVFKLG
jgi:predicted TIM-barrel fold metal-dependent hydrolase